MKMQDVLQKQQNKEILSKEDIEFVVNGFISNQISKSQMTLWLKNIEKNDLLEVETFYLTEVMLKSGVIQDLSSFTNTVDKHSTGGVSDSTTLIVVPIFALLGLTCIKMSGSALGHTGGTADKFKAFKGFKNELDEKQVSLIAKQHGACFITSTKDIAPADKKIYALRDEINVMTTGLIASSIMSKKLATGNKNLILDVKWGNGAFLKTKKQALILAKLMQKIGFYHGVNTYFVLGDMNQPLGSYVGDFCEVAEVINTLKYGVETRLLKHSLKLVSVLISKIYNKEEKQIYKQALELVKNGEVLKKLEEIVIAQGGEFCIKDFEIKEKYIVKSNKSGIISKIETKALGFLNKSLQNQQKNYKGFHLLAELNDKIEEGQPVFELYFESNDFEKLSIDFNNLIKTKKVKS